MPPVNWDVFAQLPGSVESNFEMLCRALVSRHYGQHGNFAALANQPGVEFHLNLHTQCSLGEPGRWYGWQCRWYDLPSGRAIGTTRRAKIEKALRTTEAELPNLTDWVLWTRHPLTEGDQKWFNELQTQMRLHQWTAAEVEEHLSGDAEILRGAYFGELILTPSVLTDLHTQSVAPIRRRWQPEVHQPVDAERAFRQMLGEKSIWEFLLELADQLEKDANAIDADLNTLDSALVDITASTTILARAMSGTLRDRHALLEKGDIELLRQLLSNRPPLSFQQAAVLPRMLRSRRHHAALTVTNALADARTADKSLTQLDIRLGRQLFAVLADAGCGKTELAAQLAAPVSERPPGILLHGRELHAGQTLNDFARQVVIQGKPVTSIEALVAAVDAAGQRAGSRLPIVIDGLNEAEDPRDWKSGFASLNAVLHRYPYVLIVCTLRTAFNDEALPPEIERVALPGFAHDTVEAIQRYFDYYRINPADAELDLELLGHPLTLRLFCEVTNSERKHVVGVEAMPGSLTALFDRYMDQAAQRIAELSPRTQRYVSERMLAAVYGVAMARQHPAFDPEFVKNVLPTYGRRLYEEMFAPSASSGTTHLLARDYAKRTIDIALRHHPSLLTEDERAYIMPPYCVGGIRAWDKLYGVYEGPLGFDFRNYTLGRLVPGRSPYDDKHTGYQNVKANILWRVYQLGYTQGAFESIDRQIREGDDYRRMADGGKTERYGKKYARIAYFELAGYRTDCGLLEKDQPDRSSDVNIDPSFPDNVEEADVDEPDLLGDRILSLHKWLELTDIPPLSACFVVQEINGNSGPWILLNGFVRQEDSTAKRKIVVSMNGLFCKTAQVDLVINALQQSDRYRSGLDTPGDYLGPCAS